MDNSAQPSGAGVPGPESGGRGGGAHRGSHGPGDAAAATPGEAQQWGPKPALTTVLFVAAAGAALWCVVDSVPEDRVVAGTLAAVFVLVAALLLRFRARLRADRQGITIAGIASSRRVTWPEVQTISTPLRGRFGRRAPSLEIEVRRTKPGTAAPAPSPRDDAVDHPVDNPVDNYVDSGVDNSPAAAQTDPLDTELLVFGVVDLGEDPAAVGRALRRLKNQ